MSTYPKLSGGRQVTKEDPREHVVCIRKNSNKHNSDSKESTGEVAKRSCQSCANIPDSTHWTVREPALSRVDGVSVYSLNSPPGSHECKVSGLRWVCADDVTLKIIFKAEEVFAAQLEMLQYIPIGPLMDIKILSGELEEIHLPHYLCWGDVDHSKLRESVKVLHGDDDGISLQTCRLTRFHAILTRPRFSLLETIISLFSLGAPRTHCEVLIYQSYANPLILNTYVVPEKSTAKHAIENEWKSRGIHIKKSPPNESFRINSNLKLITSCESEIEPKEITLSNNSSPAYFEVCIKDPLNEFNFDLSIAGQGGSKWKAIMRKGADYKETMSSLSPDREGSPRLSIGNVVNFLFTGTYF